MCIMLCAMSHRDYAFILGSNRDEFLTRPTKEATWYGDILIPVDLARKEHGSWIGIRKNGRFCCLVNYKEVVFEGQVSRGLLTRDYLESDLDPLVWLSDIQKKTCNFEKVGGFSLFFGNVKTSEFYIISNRSQDVIKPFDTCKVLGLSNSTFLEPWPKVLRGEQLIGELLQKDLTLPELTEDLFKIMSETTISVNIPLADENFVNDTMTYNMVDNVKHSIFVPKLKNDEQKRRSMGEFYGTRTQTVITVSRSGEVVYTERDVSSQSTIQHVFNLV